MHEETYTEADVEGAANDFAISQPNLTGVGEAGTA